MDQRVESVAQDVAEALIALGWPVTRYGPDMDHWQVGDLIWTDDELMGLASRQSVHSTVGRLSLIMPKELALIVRALHRKVGVTDADIEAAVDSYLREPAGKPYPLVGGDVLDVAAAVEAYGPAQATMAEEGINRTFRRTIVRTAVILAVALKR